MNTSSQTQTTQTNSPQAASAQPVGKIMLVGLGPGSQEHLSARALAAIAEADTVVGYVTYMRLVADLLEGKEVIKKAMTEEIDRAILALERARAGKKVALISSGDAGVYGMAGPTYEVLFEAGWQPGETLHDAAIDVEIIPGASALNSCAALVGAPLTHDFCAISLSDLLTPWPVIARRLAAAAAADFVIALYNPKSGRRSQQIVHAQQLLLAERDPETPVAIVKSAYRPKQNIQLTTLAKMTECEIGMLSTVLIGNSHTYMRHGLMVTPRGYDHKYSVEDGRRQVHAGEQAGRSLSTGLLGWQEELRAAHAGQNTGPDQGQGQPRSAAELAACFKLPLAYIESLLTAAPEPSSATADTGTTAATAAAPTTT